MHSHREDLERVRRVGGDHRRGLGLRLLFREIDERKAVLVRNCPRDDVLGHDTRAYEMLSETQFVLGGQCSAICAVGHGAAGTEDFAQCQAGAPSSGSTTAVFARSLAGMAAHP